MAEDLRSLVGAGSVRELQEKLENWHQDYEINSSGENMSRCCEILELNTAIQKQLFSILNETSQEDSDNKCEAPLKSCLAPSVCCAASGGGKLTRDSTGEELQLSDLASNPKCRLRELEEKLAETRTQICQMQHDLKATHSKDCKTLKKLHELNDYERQIKLLRDEISALDAQKSALHCRFARSCTPHPCPSSPCHSAHSCPASPCHSAHPCPASPCHSAHPCPASPCHSAHSCSPSICPVSHPCTPRACHPAHPCTASACPVGSVKCWSPCQTRRIHASRRACLIARFNFIYAKERLDAEARLRPFVCDMEMVQRIIYIAAVESFRAAKLAFWKIKINVKETLTLCHLAGPTSLEVAVLDYIASHKDLFDVCCSVQEVICTMNMNPKLPCPGEVDFAVISSLIRELCCLAFSMQTVLPPLDIAVGVAGEIFNRTMYYRSCDSDYSAPFVAYHVWPALMENGAVIVKGEVVTKRTVPCCHRSRIRSRSCGCGRRLLPGQVARSRSLSAMRVKKP